MNVIYILSALLNVIMIFAVLELKAQQLIDNENLDARTRQLVSVKEMYDEEKRKNGYLNDRCSRLIEQYRKQKHICENICAEAKDWKSRYLFEKKMKEDSITNLLTSEAERFKEKTNVLKMNRQFMAAAWLERMRLPVEEVGTEVPKVALKWRMGERVKKLKEELTEATTAWYRCDLPAFMDAMADISFAAECAGPMMGYDSNAAFKAVYKSNMTKDPYQFEKDGRGKGPDFKEPDFSDAMKRSQG